MSHASRSPRPGSRPGAAWALGLALGVTGAACVAWLAWTPGPMPGQVALLPPPGAQTPVPRVTGADPSPPAPSAPAAPAASVAQAASESLPAHWSMADAKARGDDRTPPIVRSAAPALGALPPLGDHAAYARREEDANRRWKQDYAKAVDTELPEMAKLIARGEREGVPAEALEKMRRKMEGLKAARQQLAQELGASAPVPPPASSP